MEEAVTAVWVRDGVAWAWRWRLKWRSGRFGMFRGEPRCLPVLCRHLLNNCTFRKLLGRPSSTAQAGGQLCPGRPQPRLL